MIFFSSGTHDPQLVPHLSLSCNDASNAPGLPRPDKSCAASASLISCSATLKQLQTIRPCGLKPWGALADGINSRRPSAATGCSLSRYSFNQPPPKYRPPVIPLPAFHPGPG